MIIRATSTMSNPHPNKYPYIDTIIAACSGATVGSRENADPNRVESAARFSPSPCKDQQVQGTTQAKSRPIKQLLHPGARASSSFVPGLALGADSVPKQCSVQPAVVSSKKGLNATIGSSDDRQMISSSSPTPENRTHSTVVVQDDTDPMAHDSVYQFMKDAYETKCAERQKVAEKRNATSSGAQGQGLRSAATLVAAPKPYERRPAAGAQGKAGGLPVSNTTMPRNPRDWDVDQDAALLMEVVEGETLLMMKSKGSKFESLQRVKRCEGIPL